MKQNPKLLGFYNYTVILTYIGMLSGFLGIVRVFESRAYEAVLCLMAAGFCDMFDGAIASTMERTEQEKSFGIQIDSLSDLICFGVLPGLLVYSVNQERRAALWVAGGYVLCALIRLAYFNVDEQERQRSSDGHRESYLGMPVTLSALFLPLLYGAENLSSRLTATALIPLLLCMAVLFLVPIPLKKPRLRGKLLLMLCGVAEVIVVICAAGCAG